MTTAPDNRVPDEWEPFKRDVNAVFDKYGPLGLAALVSDGDGGIHVIWSEASGGYTNTDLESGEGFLAEPVTYREAIEFTIDDFETL